MSAVGRPQRNARHLDSALDSAIKYVADHLSFETVVFGELASKYLLFVRKILDRVGSQKQTELTGLKCYIGPTLQLLQASREPNPAKCEIETASSTD